MWIRPVARTVMLHRWAAGHTAAVLLAVVVGCVSPPKPRPQLTLVDQLADRGSLTQVDDDAVPRQVRMRYQAEFPTTHAAAVYRYEHRGEPAYVFVLERKADSQWMALDIGVSGQTIGRAQALEQPPEWATSAPADAPH